MSARVSSHPFRDVAVVGVHNTRQARVLADETTHSIQLQAALGALQRVGLDRSDVDGVVSSGSEELIYALGIGPVWSATGEYGLAPVVLAAHAIAAGIASTVLVVEGSAGVYTDRASTAPWTRPTNEFVVAVGLFTAAEFALPARRHMEVFGTTSEQLAIAAATIRNNGHVNPHAAYFGRGPFTAQDVLSSRMIADPFHLYDCSATTEGAVGMILTTADRARDLTSVPVHILGCGSDQLAPGYRLPPAWDLHAYHSDEYPLGLVGRRAARRAFAAAGLRPADVQLLELYDAFSFEVIRQIEAFEFVGLGEGGPFVEEGNIAPDGRLPANTDGGLMSYSHSGSAQALQRIGRAVEQIQGVCASTQLEGIDVALASYGGAGVMRTDCMILGRERP